MKRFYAVTVYNRYNPKEKREEFVRASSAEEAEEAAVSGGLICREEGWFVEGSRPVLRKGDLVKWNDPGIDDYIPEEREYILNRVFEIISEVDGDDEDELIEISEVGNGSFVEVPAHELVLSEELPLKIRASVTKADIARTEQVLIDNGIDPEDAKSVLQSVGYFLLGVELYGNKKSIEIHNAEAE